VVHSGGFVNPNFESEQVTTLLAQKLQVHGVVWMDHQWGNFLTLGRGCRDWYSIQLNNDTELMLYLIRDATGKTISTYVEDVGQQADVHLLPPGALRVDVLDHWMSPVTGVNYPFGWRLEINKQQFQASLTLMPELKDQELVVYQSMGNSYWEGTASIQE
jgi:predicted secreted hydrolase